MKIRVTEKKLKRFYRLLSVRMIDFDCGTLCAPDNDGIPICCENEYVIPLLFRDEYNWHRKNSKFWKPVRPVTKEIKKFIEEAEDYYVFSQCPGPQGCIRSKRSLNCMTFPLEPHVSKDGNVQGLAYINGKDVKCPLIGRPGKIYSPVYIANSIRFWEELFECYPEERETYRDESRKRERNAKRRGKKAQVFKPRKS